MEELLQIAGYLVSVFAAAAIVMGIEALNERVSAMPSPARRAKPVLSVAVSQHPAPLQRSRS